MLPWPLPGGRAFHLPCRSRAEVLHGNVRLAAADAGVRDPAAVSAELEQQLFDHFGGVNEDYKEKCKMLLMTLRDAKNPDFRGGLLSGSICIPDVPEMASTEVASAEKRAEIQQLRCAVLILIRMSGRELPMPQLRLCVAALRVPVVVTQH